ncbi:chemotaxis protein CheW [Pantoea alhagi]|uniref:Chemotaxis protein CheW n=1 Tax=Pantoea alhagi TaxID=1891675 RepID=A0A1W6B421_9GAMM|nr:chemotaxis protein CheW [Pantoea alhagi]ARJ41845.1 chemotaxis protein CheW [Pantoea alhagi]URQ60861.1 chemotaxis protein CheW [Pantoea alhagi]
MTASATEKKTATDNHGNEYLVFTLGNEEYGIEILKVQEIRGCERVTRLANTPEFITGVTNLRGVIVPIVDLRIKFDLAGTEINEKTVVIVLSLAQRVVGIVVDGVSDVLSLNAEEIKPAPDFSVTLSTDYLLGLGSVDERMIILVDIEKLLTSEEMELVEKSVNETL